MNRLVYVLNGPNLNLLGLRQPQIYGHETLADVERDCRVLGGELGLELRFHQSNREYETIDWVHEARGEAGGIVINPAAFTHTSVAILDALHAFLSEPRRAVDCFGVLFARAVDDGIYGLATGEAMAHLRRLEVEGRARREVRDGVAWFSST